MLPSPPIAIPSSPDMVSPVTKRAPEKSASFTPLKPLNLPIAAQRLVHWPDDGKAGNRKIPPDIIIMRQCKVQTS
jgi:hypothetical protein